MRQFGSSGLAVVASRFSLCMSGSSPKRMLLGRKRACMFRNSFELRQDCLSTQADIVHGNKCSKNDKPHRHNIFLKQVETTIHRVLEAFPRDTLISNVKPQDREALAISRRLDSVIRQFYLDGKCPRCWLKDSFCVCASCPPLEANSLLGRDNDLEGADRLPPKFHRKIKRIYVLMHHQEICLAADTSKMILAALPQSCRLVVAGIGPEYQPSMKEMMEAMGMARDSGDTVNVNKQNARKTKCLVLFPDQGTKTFTDLQEGKDAGEGTDNLDWNLIVLDGTWSQARRIYERYIPLEADGGPLRVKLGDQDIDRIAASPSFSTTNDSGRQLRKHPIQWREISTLEALRLLLRDMLQDDSTAHTTQERNPTDGPPHSTPIWDVLSTYQQIANSRARQQRGR